MYKVIVNILLVIFTLPAFAQQDTIFRSLTATQVDGGILINFTILGGITCSGVEIERSSDGMLFYEMYEIPGVCGGLSSDQSYSFTDNFPLNNSVSYYRLDLGSLGLYSDIIPIRYIDFAEKKYFLFPNPCYYECTIYFSNPNSEKSEIRFFNSGGKLVNTNSITTNYFTILPGSLAAGLYFFQLVRGNEVRFKGKVIVGE